MVVLGLAWALRPRSEDPLALGPTILAGVGGAVLGGIVSSLLGAEEGPPGLRTVFFASSGAMVTMLVFRLLRRRGNG